MMFLLSIIKQTQYLQLADMFGEKKMKKHRKNVFGEKENYLYDECIPHSIESIYRLKPQQIDIQPFNRIGIIKGRFEKQDKIFTLCNAFLISSRIILTTFASISDRKSKSFQNYYDLQFYLLEGGIFKAQKGVKIKYYDPMKIKNTKSFINNNNGQIFDVFILETPINENRDSFIKPTINVCKTCLLGKQEKYLSLVGYQKKEITTINGDRRDEYALLKFQDKNRVFKICNQTSLIYFNFMHKQLLGGCPLFVDRKCIGIYLSSRKDRSKGLLFNQRILEYLKTIQASLQRDQIISNQFDKCYHNELLNHSNSYLQQRGRMKLLQNSNILLQGKINISKFMKLQYLDLRNNQIKSIIFDENCINLKYLNLSKNNVEQIDLKSLKKLHTFKMSHNILSHIDLSSNTQIRILQADHNNLSQITLNHNELLTVVYLNNNHLKQIDLCNNQLIQKLNLDNNLLSRFIYSQLKKLRKISLRNNINLFKLQIKSDQLTQIYMSCFDIPYNLINEQQSQVDSQEYELARNSYQVDERNCRFLISPKKIQLLSIENWGLHYFDFVDFNGLFAYENLIVLYLNGNKIDNIKLSSVKKLTKLSIDYNQLTALILNDNINLVYVSASNNKIKCIDIKDNPKLEEFYLNSNLLKIIDFSHNSQLQKVHLNKNQLTEIIFGQNTQLKYLQIKDNSLIKLDTSKSPLLQTIIIGQDYLSSVKVAFNPNLLEKLMPIYNEQYGYSMNKQEQEMKRYQIINEQAGEQKIFLFKIIIVANESDNNQCIRWIDKLKSLKNIIYFKNKQKCLPLFQKNLAYNNFIYEFQQNSPSDKKQKRSR